MSTSMTSTVGSTPALISTTVGASIMPLLSPTTAKSTETETHWSATLEFTTITSNPSASANTAAENDLPSYVVPLLGGLVAFLFLILIGVLGYCLVR